MKSNGMKTLKLTKKSISNLSTIVGGLAGGTPPAGGDWNAAPSTAGPSWNCNSKDVCTR
ncbi:hypothetical protein [uncultured Kordia sp.]|uniref:VENN motif pre-toxin domain-containing protein n=1 Tax=uncultured Kordia sp. TaxID=507699 RepID=UPI002630A4BA|nr:hypothetical protein [uncultured Kordia sp.]